MVTNAFDPSPPLRHDCDEIFKPSAGAGCSGVIASEVRGSNEDSLARPTVTAGVARITVAVARCRGWAMSRLRVWSDTSNHAAAARKTTIGSQPMAALR